MSLDGPYLGEACRISAGKLGVSARSLRDSVAVFLSLDHMVLLSLVLSGFSSLWIWLPLASSFVLAFLAGLACLCLLRTRLAENSSHVATPLA